MCVGVTPVSPPVPSGNVCGCHASPSPVSPWTDHDEERHGEARRQGGALYREWTIWAQVAQELVDRDARNTADETALGAAIQ